MRDMVLILNYDDAGSRAVARSLRAEHVCCRIVPRDVSRAAVDALQPLGLILSGGTAGSLPPAPDGALLDGTWPVLALGDTAAALCRYLGGDAQETVICNSIGTVSFADSPLTEGINECERMLHSVRRLRLPENVAELAGCQGEIIGFRHTALPLYGVQFSLEQNDTDGMQLLLNFALSVCGCTRWWDYEAFIENAVDEIRTAAGEGRAVCAMTGGLNSGVSAMLAYRALGERLQCIFIDTGLLRADEAADFLAFYRGQAGLNVTHVQAQDRFLAALQGVVDPAEKRRVIGETLQATLDETLAGLGDFSLVIRSATCSDLMRGVDYSRRPGIHAALPTVEPLRDLFKDEVRRAGEYLDMPAAVLARQTFPGSGLALRILGEVTPARLQTLRAADQIFLSEIDAAGQGKRLTQYFAVLIALLGDDTHALIALRAVHSSDAARLPSDLLERVTERVLRDRPEVARVVYDLSPINRGTGVEWQ